MQRRQVFVGGVPIGAGSPVVVQSMTNTQTADVHPTVEQIIQLYAAGSRIVRITVNDSKAAAAVPHIRDELIRRGYFIPLVGCFHYNGHELLKHDVACAMALDKYRINPGNVGVGRSRDRNFETIIQQALKYDKPVRIGVNWGSVDPMILADLSEVNARSATPVDDVEISIQAVIESALQSASYAVNILSLSEDRIVISAKVSAVQHLVRIYRELARRSNYALHLGLTEAGTGISGITNTVSALSILLSEGIGDTIRASVTPGVNQSRTFEVNLCYEVLRALGLASRYPRVIACPGCGRTDRSYFQMLAQKVDDYVHMRMDEEWYAKNPEISSLTVAVMGCIVNGPGESKHANIGISLPGNGENLAAPVYIDGKRAYILKGNDIDNEFIAILERYVQEKYLSFS